MTPTKTAFESTSDLLTVGLGWVSFRSTFVGGWLMIKDSLVGESGLYRTEAILVVVKFTRKSNQQSTRRAIYSPSSQLTRLSRNWTLGADFSVRSYCYSKASRFHTFCAPTVDTRAEWGSTTQRVALKTVALPYLHIGSLKRWVTSQATPLGIPKIVATWHHGPKG